MSADSSITLKNFLAVCLMHLSWLEHSGIIYPDSVPDADEEHLSDNPVLSGKQSNSPRPMDFAIQAPARFE